MNYYGKKLKYKRKENKVVMTMTEQYCSNGNADHNADE